MSVIHILKDGSVVHDITGHVVRIEDAEPLYQLIDEINRRSYQLIHKNEVKAV